jgi:curved DNA-binding protein
VNNERVQVRIPAGVKNGSRLRLKGKGNLQPGTGRRGDLYLNLSVKEHSVWRQDGEQLQADLPVSLDELALGATVTVMTPDGEAQVSIPAGTAPDRSLRLKGKGWPLKGRRGDLLLTLALKMPSSWTADEQALLNKLREQRAENPRHDWLRSAAL